MKDAELKACAEKATPGPWHWHEGDVCESEHNDVYLAEGDAPDLQYMIAACNEVPKLLARIAALREAIQDAMDDLPPDSMFHHTFQEALAADDKVQND